uniref:Uncharacterized protein n=1 Tax=Panagrolaimus sp. ES5 TaxID=591445 RepID=A0AC34FEX3_9BILA
MMKSEDELENEIKTSEKESSKSNSKPKSKKKKAHQQRKRKSSTTSRTSKASRKSRKSKSSISKPKKVHQVVKVRKIPHHPKQQQQQQRPVASSNAAAAEVSKKEKVATAADPEDTVRCCFVFGFFTQTALFVASCIAVVLTYSYMKNNSILDAFGYLAFAQFEFLMVMLFGICVSCCTWFSLFNCITLLLCELGCAVYITVMDLQEECHEFGCTCVQGDLLHRIIFIATCLIFGAIHAIMAASIPAALCVTPSNAKKTEVAAVKNVQQPVQPLRKRRQSVSTSRSRSRSRSVSSKRSANPRHVAKRVPVDRASTLSWSTLPSSKFLSTCPSDSSQKLSSFSTSSCPYSASIVANSQASNQQQPRQQQQQAAYPYYGYPGSDTVAVTFPSATSVHPPEYQSVTVRMPMYGYPPAGAPAYYPQQPAQVTYYPSHAAAAPQQQQHNQHVLVSFPSTSDTAPPPPQPPHHYYAASTKTAKCIPGKNESDSFYNFSQTSENLSVVLPNSFASRDSINGSQGIFIANTPSTNQK